MLLFDRERGRIFFKSTGARLVVHCEVLSLFTSVALSALPARSGRGEKVQIPDEERKGGEEGREREEAESRPVTKLQFFLGRGKDSRQGRNSSFDNGCSSFFLLNFSPGWRTGNRRLKKILGFFSLLLLPLFFYRINWNGIWGGNYWENNREGIICVLARTKRWSKVKYGMGWVCLIYTKCRAKRGGGRKMNRSSDVYIVLTRELEKLKSR